ncbi:hypothetical protein [Streptomyces malaysiensis]|uniref:hypothetical protein n=1 Tax=Streptomyces malaysiensis TaxID=92644 RepID=UPI0037146601
MGEQLTDGDGAGSADLVTYGEVLAEGVGHCAIAFIHVTANHAAWYIELEDHYFPFISRLPPWCVG